MMQLLYKKISHIQKIIIVFVVISISAFWLFQANQPASAALPVPVGTVSGGVNNGSVFTLGLWDPGQNELILVGVGLRHPNRTVSLSGNGLTFVEVHNLDNARGQGGVHLFRAMNTSADPPAGQITVTITGGATYASAIATRFSGVDTSGSNGSGAVEVTAYHLGPPITPNNDVKVDITTLSNESLAYAFAWHRLRDLSNPPAAGESVLALNICTVCTGGNATKVSAWYEPVNTVSTVTLGADNDLSGNTDWTIVAAAIKPLAPIDVTASSLGTQLVNLNIPSTDQYLGAAFAIKENTSSRNVTGLTITENGTVNAQTGLDNIKLFYDLDTTAPYDCADESYAGAESQFGATDADSFSGADGTASFTDSVLITATRSMCLYVVLDVLSSAAVGETIQVEISDPVNQITISSGIIEDTGPVILAGATILESPAYAVLGTYISSNFNTGAPSVFNVIEWAWSKTNPGCAICNVRLQIQTAPDESGAPGVWSLTWSGPEGEDGDETDYFTLDSGETIHTDHNGDQWVRYKATLDGNGTDTPILESIKIFYQPQ